MVENNNRIYGEIYPDDPIVKLGNVHYSKKGGHMLRGKYWRIQEVLDRSVPGGSLPVRSLPTPTAQIIRRSIRRTPQDGRR